MNDRIAIHAVWASATMYCVAVVCLTVYGIQRHLEPQTAESIAAKLLALFGPLMTLLSAVAFRGRNNGGKGEGGRGQ